MSTQKVSLKIQYTTSFGEVLFISGSFWDNWHDQVLMTWHEGGHWEYVFNVPSPRDTLLTITYKYLVRNEATGATRWESTPNRTLTIGRSLTTKSYLVTDTWEHPEATRCSWGLTRDEEAREERRRRAEEAEARKAGLDFFKKTLQASKKEAEARRRKEEEDLARRELQRSARASEEEQRRAKILSSRHAAMTSSGSSSSLTSSGSNVSTSESIIINPAVQTDLIYNGTTSPILPFSQFAPRYSSSPREFSPMSRMLVGRKDQQQQQQQQQQEIQQIYVPGRKPQARHVDVDEDVEDDFVEDDDQ